MGETHRRISDSDVVRMGKSRDVEGLIEALKYGESVLAQRLAISFLGELGDRRAVEPLIQELNDKDADVRTEAVRALVNLGDLRAFEPLLWALKDPCERTRSAAAFALGKLGDTRALEPLIQILKTETTNVRVSAAIALGKLGDRRAVEPLIQALKDGAFEVRYRAAEALGLLGDRRAVEPLIQAVERDWAFEVRYRAAEALGKLGDQQAVEYLIQALKDGNREVQVVAEISLKKILAGKGVKFLKKILAGKGVKFLERALKGKTGMEEFERLSMIERIIYNIAENRYIEGWNGVDIKEDFQRFNPIKYKEIIKEKGGDWFLKRKCEVEDVLFYDAMGELFQYMQGGESKVRHRAMCVFRHALAATHGLIGDRRLEHAWKVEEEANQTKYWDFFVNAMKDDDENIREEAQSIIGCFWNSVKIPCLYRLLNNENPHVRRGVRETLADMIHDWHSEEAVKCYIDSSFPEWWVHAQYDECFDYEEYLDYLLEAAGQEDDDIREKIASELENLDRPLPCEVFIKKLSGSNDWIREFSAKMLRRLTYSEEQEKRAVKALKDLLSDPNPKVRKTAVETMGEYYNWPEPEENLFTDALIKALGDMDQGVKEAALEALGKLSVDKHDIEEIVEAFSASLGEDSQEDKKPLNTLLRMLDGGNQFIRRLATLSLGKFQDPKIVDILIGLLSDKNDLVREAAALVLRFFPCEKVEESLIVALSDSNSCVLKAVAKTLGEIGSSRAVEPLIKFLKGSKSARVLEVVVETLGKIGDRRAVEPLIEVLKNRRTYDPSYNFDNVRSEAAWALGKIKDTMAVEPLILALNDKEGIVRSSAARALGKIGDARAALPLTRALNDEEEYVREAAKEALQYMSQKRVTENGRI